MAYDEGLAARLRDLLEDTRGADERAMFGGLAFLLRGNMCCGIIGDELIVRVGPERYEHALAQPHTRVFDLTGRTMKGWVVVTADGYETDEALAAWVRQGVDFALSLPPK
jgi:TfoX/Sxy family transcriptional regulator of competence genes